MRILYLTEYFSSGSGGGEIVFFNMARSMLERGHEVTVICKKMMESQTEEVPCAEIYRISPKTEHKGALPSSISQNLWFIANAIMTGIMVIRSRKIQLIHTNSYSSIIAGSILGKLHGIPVIATIHDIFTTSSPNSWKTWAAYNNLGWIHMTAGYLLERLMVNMPLVMIHAVTNATQRDILRLNERARVRVIPNGIDWKSFIGESNISYENFIVFTGRLVYYKNLEVVIRAFELVTKQIPTAKLIIIGNGPMKSHWLELSSKLGLLNNVKFKGFVGHNEKLSILRRCTALVLPSVHEGFPVVILESFAMGKPVLVSNLITYEGIVQEGVEGFLIPPHDHKKWAEKIILLLSQPDLCQTMGKRSVTKVGRFFDVKKVTDTMEGLYVEVLNQH